MGRWARRILVGGPLALLWFLAMFYAGFVTAFPEEAARQRLAWEVREATGGALELSAASLSPWRLTGLRLGEVEVLKHPTRPIRRPADDDAEGQDLPVLLARLDELAGRVEVLPLLAGERALAWRAALYDGEVSGRVALDDETIEAAWEGEGIDLARVPLEGEDWSADAQGHLALHGELRWSPDDFSTLEGEAGLEVDDLAIDALTVMGMTIDRVKFSQAELALEASDGRAEVKKGRFVSDLLEAEVGGEVVLNRVPARSRLKLTVKLKLAEEYDKLVQVMPTMKRARDDDGVYHFSVMGTVQRPRMREDVMAARGRQRPDAARRRAGGNVRRPSTVRDRVDPEEAQRRREERRQRLLERKEALKNRKRPLGGPATDTLGGGPGTPPPPPGDMYVEPEFAPDGEAPGDFDPDQVEELGPAEDPDDVRGGYVE